jgi:hypothetical protein
VENYNLRRASERIILVMKIREGRVSKTHGIPVTITEINARIFP